MTTALKKLRPILAAFLMLTLTFQVFAQPNAQNAKVQNLMKDKKSGFQENKGQITDQYGVERKDVKYLYSAPGMKLVLKSNSFSYEVFNLEKKKKAQEFSEATGLVPALNFPDKFKEPEEVTVKTHRVDVSFTGANPNPEIIAEGKSSEYKNYYLAHTPEEGVTNVFTYNKVTYKNLYPKIDIVFYAKEEGKLKYDIIVHPGGKLENVKMKYDGANALALANGKLKVKTALGEIEEEIPYSFLTEDKQEVSVKHLLKNNQVSFNGKYDRNKTLVIDPTLKWGTYYGGEEGDYIYDISRDDNGNIYIAGETYSKTGIATSGAHQPSYIGPFDGWIGKFNSNGNLEWGTYFNGNRGSNHTHVFGVVHDLNGNIYVTGITSSDSGLATPGSFQQVNPHTNWNGNEAAFLAKFNSNGSRQWCTYYGGEGKDFGNDICIDNSGDIYIIGSTFGSSGLSTTGAHQTSNGGNMDAFIAKFNSNGSRLWGTYYGE